MLKGWQDPIYLTQVYICRELQKERKEKKKILKGYKGYKDIGKKESTRQAKKKKKKKSIRPPKQTSCQIAWAAAPRTNCNHLAKSCTRRSLKPQELKSKTGAGGKAGSRKLHACTPKETEFSGGGRGGNKRATREEK